MRVSTVWIAAGGTGGHVFPGIVVAQALRIAGVQVCWLGTTRGIESRVVPEAGLTLWSIMAKPLRGQSFMQTIWNAWVLIGGVVQVLWLGLRDRPDRIISMGGFVAAPVGLAARILNIPLILHEQNAIAGSTHRVLARWARHVLVAHPGAFSPAVKQIVTGNPVRSDIQTLGLQMRERAERPIRCLVLGGSQGARRLNQLVADAFLKMPESARPELWHQVGHMDVQALRVRYQSCCPKVQVNAFIDNMAEAYAWADVVIARSGAMTVSECLVAGLPVAWVPYPQATDQHQLANACCFLQYSPGWIWLQYALTAEGIIQWWARCDQTLAQLHVQAQTSAQQQPQAMSRILSACLEL